jgi:Tol biopolymer transport system component
MDTEGQTSPATCAGEYWCSPVYALPPSSDLKAMDVRTGRISPVTTSPAIELESRFSPNGSVLAYSVVGDGFQSLDTIRPDGSDHHRLVAIPGKLADAPTWSPDGKRIAFVLETASSTGSNNAAMQQTGERPGRSGS